jgi:hypothetical protein
MRKPRPRRSAAASAISIDLPNVVVAAIADPLWLLGRQWQLGELGEDVGTPVSVKLKRRALPITAWAPAGSNDGTDGPVDEPTWRPWPANAVLDELVEQVSGADQRRGLRWRAETSAQLEEMLREGGHDDVADALRGAHPLDLPNVNVDSASETRHSPPPVQLTHRPPTVVRARSLSFRHLPDQPCARAAPRSAERGHADAGRHRQTAAGVRDTETADAGRAPRSGVEFAVKARSAHRHRAGGSGRNH